MTEPLAQLQPHRSPVPPLDPESDPSFVGPPAPARALTRAQQLQLVANVHQVVTALLGAVSALEAIPEEIWHGFELMQRDLSDTTLGAATAARSAYEKALAVEIVLAKAMR